MIDDSFQLPNTCLDGTSHQIFNDRDHGQLVCQKCGLILDSGLIDTEWSLPRIDKNSITKSGGNIEFESPGMPRFGSTLKPKLFDQIPAELKRAIKRNVSYSWLDKKMLIGAAEIRRLCEQFGIPSALKDQSILLFQQAIKANSFKGRQIRLIIYSILLFNCRNNQISLHIDSILRESGYSEQLFYRYYYLLLKTLKLRPPILSPHALIPEIGEKLHLDQDILSISRQILTRFLSLRGIGAFDPHGIAAAAVYMACKLNFITRSQSEIAKAAFITECTLRHRFKLLETVWN